jgi:hypothetical protein
MHHLERFGTLFEEPGSKFFGMDQRVEEINPQAESDDQSDDRFDHMRIPSQSVASDGVESHQDEEQDSDGDVDDVSHGEALRFHGGVLRLATVRGQCG